MCKADTGSKRWWAVVQSLSDAERPHCAPSIPSFPSTREDQGARFQENEKALGWGKVRASAEAVRWETAGESQAQYLNNFN